MFRRIPKRYGESLMQSCPFCGKGATTTNSQGLLVCTSHKSAVLGEMRCVCGEYLELKKGPTGAYFKCLRCGLVNLKRVLQVNIAKDISGN